MSSSVFLARRLEVDVGVDGNLGALHRAEEGVWEAEVCTNTPQAQVTPYE